MEKNLKKASNELMEIEDTLFEEMQETYRNELERRLQAKVNEMPVTSPDGSILKKKRRVSLCLTSIFGNCRLIVWKGFSESSGNGLLRHVRHGD